MRKMRKSLSFVLILALVLGSFSMVFASNTSSASTVLSDIDGIGGYEQVTVAHNLGIIEGFPDGTFRPTEPVNRAQFAAMITRALAIPESALAGFGTTTFQDTAGFGWAIRYLAFCQTRGIMIGDGHGNAMPGRTITVNEAVTMVLRAVGYVDHSSELVGRWPANFVALGQALNLYDDLTTGVVIDRENAAILLFNALTVDLVTVAGDGTTRFVLNNAGTRNLTMAELLGCTVEKQVIDDFFWGNSIIDVASRFGAYGYTFVNRDGLLVAFRAESEFVTGTFARRGIAGGFEYTGNFVTTDGRTLSIDGRAFLDVETGAAIPAPGFLNGQMIAGAGNVATFAGVANLNNPMTSEQATSAAAIVVRPAGVNGTNRTDGAEATMAVRIVGNTVRQIYSVQGWQVSEARVVTASQANDIRNNRLLMGNFPLDFDREIDYRMFGLIGVDTLDNIQEDNVVYVYVNNQTDRIIRRVAVGQEVVDGNIGGVRTGAGANMTLDGTVYGIAYNFLTAPAWSIARNDATSDTDIAASVGEDATVRLDGFGRAFQVEADAGIRNFGVTTSTSAAIGLGRQLSLWTAEDEEEVFSTGRLVNLVADNTTVPTARKQVDRNQPAATVIGTLDTAGVPQLIGYRLSTGGNLSEIQYADGLTTAAATPGTSIIQSSRLMSLNGRSVQIDANAVVFAINPAGEIVNVGGVSILDPDAFGDVITGGEIQAVTNLANDRVVALLVPVRLADAADDWVYGVVTAADVRPNDRYMLSVNIIGQGATTQITAPDAWVGIDLRNVQLLRWRLNASGEARAFELVDTITSQTASPAWPGPGTQPVGWVSPFGTPPNSGGPEAYIATTATPAGIGMNVIVGNNAAISTTDGNLPLDSGTITVFEAGVGGGAGARVSYTPSVLSAIEPGDQVFVFDTHILSNGDPRNSLGRVVIWWSPVN